jgi:hypothetical protein
MKIDTQEIERQVHNGPRETLACPRRIMAEQSLASSLFTKRLWREIVVRLEPDGSARWGIRQD